MHRFFNVSNSQIRNSLITSNKSFSTSINKSTWSFIEPSKPDPILGLSVAFNKDTHHKKVNLGVGAYRDSKGKPYVLQSVRKAQEKQLGKDLEYAPIEGLQSFIKCTQKLAFGNNQDLIDRTATVQTLSGTGSLRIAAEFLRHNYLQLNKPTIYIPNPTWPNHKNILSHSNLTWSNYPYYSKTKNQIDFDQMVKKLNEIESKSVIMFHACAHNPTGADPTLEQWTELSKICKKKSHTVWFDSAYQGFASGDPVKDAQSFNIFINDGHNILLSQSYAKNMGLYGMRVGALSVVTSSPNEKENVLGNLKSIIRPIYSNPPIEGARIVSEIINDPELNKLWYDEIKMMSDRIKEMRSQLRMKIEKLGSKRDWSHITNQIGMFCYTGLSEEEVGVLVDNYHIYMTSDGRISMAGVTPENVDYIAHAIFNVLAARSKL